MQTVRAGQTIPVAAAPTASRRQIARRLEAARVLAGKPSLRTLATQTGMSYRHLVAVANGSEPLLPSDARDLAVTFDCPESFLCDGWGWGRDRLSYRARSALAASSPGEGDMRRLMILSACVVGVLAASAANALATPEIARCVSQPVTGKYWTAGCTVKLAGQHFFELKKGAEGHLNFTATSGEPVFQGASGVGVICLVGTATGVYKEVNGKINSVEHVVWTLTGCQLLGFDAVCNSAGQAEETIVSHELKGKLGYLAGEKTNTPRLGLQLEPSDKRAFAEFDCGGGLLTGKLESIKGHNCVISELTPPNTMSETISQVFETEGKSAKQKWTHFEPTPTKTCQLDWSLNGGPRELVGQVLNQTVTSEIPLMVHGI